MKIFMDTLQKKVTLVSGGNRGIGLKYVVSSPERAYRYSWAPDASRPVIAQNRN